MKKIYTLIALLSTTLTLSAQSYDLELVLVTPTQGSSIVGEYATNVEFNLINNGPDAIAIGDTIWFDYIQGANTYSLDGTLSAASGFVVPAPIVSGASFSSNDIGGLVINLGSITSNVSICVRCKGVNGAVNSFQDPNDTNNANNINCFTATPPANVGLTEATIEISVYPNPVSNELNITSSDEVSSVAVITMDGKVVAYSKTTKVDVSALVSGVYIYEVNTTSGKVSRGTFMKN